MAVETHLFRCRSDNFGVLIRDTETGAVAAIDAPETSTVEAALQAKGWKLTDILVTHHHADHTDGIADLKKKYGCRVVAPRAEAAKIPQVDETVREGDKVAFAGDTLFSIGCGRVIEGTMDQMWNSLLKLRDLPGDTRVYCGHEYTLANIKFAQTIEPDNKALIARAAQAAQQVAAGQPTVPTTIDEEKVANVFLRADVPSVAAAVGLSDKSAAEVFAEIRTRKNKF
jgi:hydroxyacylglutathione hydrolase